MRATAFSILLMCFVLACTRDTTELLSLACTEDGETETRYSTNIKSIIDNSCGNSGCHDGSESFAVEYSSYDDMVPELESGKIWSEVFERFDMPIIGTEGDQNFTDEYRELFRCWIESGYPE